MRVTNASCSRRTFLQATAAGLALSAVRTPAARAQSPSDQVRFGFIGLGGMGTGRLREFTRHPDVRVEALCDVDRRHLERAAALVEAGGRPKPQIYGDFRRLLDSKDIDAVAIVTPDHWHAIPTVRAFEAGKDVFVEKPLSYCVAEGKAMADGSQRHKRVSQMGNHIHNHSPNYRRAVELVKSGKLGRITRVHCWKTSPTEPATTKEPAAQPAELDYAFWLGPAPKRPYEPLRSHYNYRHFWDYSGGTFIDFWCHIVDVAVWALDLGVPRSVSAAGGRYFVKDATETPDTVEAVLDYGNLLFLYSFRPTPLTGFEHMGHIGCLFEGTEASLVVNYDTQEVWTRGKKIEDFPRPDPTIPDSPGHLREFIDAIKARTLETTCNVRYGHQVTMPGLLANIAFRTGRRLHWDAAKERFVDDKDASRYLSRRYQNGWKLG
jgi:predicted dehydrogenase